MTLQKKDTDKGLYFYGAELWAFEADGGFDYIMTSCDNQKVRERRHKVEGDSRVIKIIRNNSLITRWLVQTSVLVLRLAIYDPSLTDDAVAP